MTSGEDTSEIVKKIGTLIDVYINDTDISISHRIPFVLHKLDYIVYKRW